MFRAEWHDYNDGIFFVTVCTKDKKHLFGTITNDEMHKNALGTIVEECIKAISEHHPQVTIHNYVIMPNHIHLIIATVGTRYIASATAKIPETTKPINPPKPFIGCLKPPAHGEPIIDYHHNSRLAVIIGSLKAAVTRIARTRCIASLPCWQSRFHEHIIRNQRAFDNIMDYIDNNVARWEQDCFNLK